MKPNRQTIKLSEIPEPYRFQVRRFLHLYPKSEGQQIASRYLQLVNSPGYGKTSSVGKPRKPRPNKLTRSTQGGGK